MVKRSAVLLAILAVLALLGGGAATGVFDGWLVAPPPTTASPGQAAADGDAATRPGLTGGAARPAQLTAANVEEVLPPPVDLEKVDRDLDLHGVVVTKDGKPVSGATLTAVRFPWQRTLLMNSKDHALEEERGQTRSARDGTFAIRLVRGEEVRLRTAAAGYATVEVDGCQAGQRVKVVMAPGVRLVVSATDEGGRPVGGLVLTLRRLVAWSGLVFERRSVTDDTGAGVFEDLPGGGGAYLETEHDAFADEYFIQVNLPESGEVRQSIVVVKGRTVTGRVTDADTGAAIAGAKVGSNWDMDRPVTTGADGRYAFAGWLGKNVQELTAHSEGYGYRSVDVGASETVDFVLQRGFVARGRIVNGATRAIAGARVAAIASNGEDGPGSKMSSHGYATSDAEGRFAIGGLDRRMGHSLVVMADGYGRTLVDFDPPAAGRDAQELGDVSVHEARSIEGRVLDASGQGVAGIAVSLMGSNDDRNRLRPSKNAPNDIYGEGEERTTDDLGRFRFPDLSPGTYQLDAHSSGRPTLSLNVRLGADHDAIGVPLRYGRLYDLDVVVAEPDGRPVLGAYVQVTDGGQSVSSKTDASGRARVSCKDPPRRVSVVYFGPGGAAYIPPPAKTVAEGQTEVRFVVERAGAVTGIVIGPDGKPLAGAIVASQRNGETLDESLTQGDGRFEIAVSAAGTVSLVLNGQNLHAKDVGEGPVYEGRVDHVSAGDKDITLHAREVPRDRSIDVQVLTPAGTPAEGAMVSVTVSSTETEVVTEADGRVEFKDLPAIRVDLRAKPKHGPGPEADWLEAHPQTVVPDGQHIVLRFREAVHLAGRVAAPGGKSAEGARVTLRAYVGMGMRQVIATTDVAGLFSSPLDPDLEWEVQADLAIDGVPHHAERKGVHAADGEFTLTLLPAK